MSDSTPSRKRAAALRYVAGEMAAPEIVAVGEGAVAERIVALAREHGIPIHEHRELAALHKRQMLEGLESVILDQRPI